MSFHRLLPFLPVLLVVPLIVYAALITNPPQPITHTVRVQPIILSDDNGANTATYFGNSAQQEEIEQFVDIVWAQAGIDVEFLTPVSWNNTFANWGAGGPPNNNGNSRSTSELSIIRLDAQAAGITHSDPTVINMFFVRIAAGFPLLSANSAAGLASIGGNGITQYVGANLLGFVGGREVIASVVAHEIGHNLGLPHPPSELQNLMSASGTANPGERLTQNQINTTLSSQFSIEIPEPEPEPEVEQIPIPAIYLVVLAMLLVFIRKSVVSNNN